MLGGNCLYRDNVEFEQHDKLLKSDAIRENYELHGGDQQRQQQNYDCTSPTMDPAENLVRFYTMINLSTLNRVVPWHGTGRDFFVP